MRERTFRPWWKTLRDEVREPGADIQAMGGGAGCGSEVREDMVENLEADGSDGEPDLVEQGEETDSGDADIQSRGSVHGPDLY